jgi:hypothetical protein
LIIWSEFFDVAGLVGFAVQVVRVKSLDGGQGLNVVLICEVRIGTLSVPRVKAVVTNHRKAFGRKRTLILEDVIEVL